MWLTMKGLDFMNPVLKHCQASCAPVCLGILAAMAPKKAMKVMKAVMKKPAAAKASASGSKEKPMSLQEKIELWRQKAVEDESVASLSNAEWSAVNGRLKTAISKNAEGKKVWEAASNVARGEGKNHAKRQCAISWLLDPTFGDGWQEAVQKIQNNQEFVKTTKEESYTSLLKRYSAEEIDALVECGDITEKKHPRAKDATIYIDNHDVHKKETNSKKRQQSQGVKKVTSDDPDAMEEETGGFSNDKSQGQKALPDKDKDKDKILKIVRVADVINNASKMKSGLEGLATKVEIMQGKAKSSKYGSKTVIKEIGLCRENIAGHINTCKNLYLQKGNKGTHKPGQEKLLEIYSKVKEIQGWVSQQAKVFG